ncbi:MAG TPA: metallophosphoesterase [Blastocatellia bacterium]|nr:metallophosphoesterase [Blastocatellia bacterium]
MSNRTTRARIIMAGWLAACLMLSTTCLAPAQTCNTRFAVIGDYGLAGQPEQDVAQLVKRWDADFIITTGDNNYEQGEAATIDQNIGQYYHEFIGPYLGRYGAGAVANRFFPALGNHDWVAPGARPYLDYFTLPGNERYYEFVYGPVRLFAIDSDPNEPDGVRSDSAQASWLRGRLAAAPEPWKIVYFHHPPYSSGLEHGSTDYMQWPFKEWGATAVLTGHDHNYERIIRDDFPYFVNGLGGRSLYPFSDVPVAGSRKRYNDDYGAMRVDATPEQITFKFITRTGELIDTYKIGGGTRRAPGEPTNLVATGVGKRTIDLAWAAAGCTHEGFKVEQSDDDVSFKEIANLGGTVTTYTAEGLARGTIYSFRVRAYNAAGDSAYSNVVRATTRRKRQ